MAKAKRNNRKPKAVRSNVPIDPDKATARSRNNPELPRDDTGSAMNRVTPIHLTVHDQGDLPPSGMTMYQVNALLLPGMIMYPVGETPREPLMFFGYLPNGAYQFVGIVPETGDQILQIVPASIALGQDHDKATGIEKLRSIVARNALRSFPSGERPEWIFSYLDGRSLLGLLVSEKERSRDQVLAINHLSDEERKRIANDKDGKESIWKSSSTRHDNHPSLHLHKSDSNPSIQEVLTPFVTNPNLFPHIRNLVSEAKSLEIVSILLRTEHEKRNDELTWHLKNSPYATTRKAISAGLKTEDLLQAVRNMGDWETNTTEPATELCGRPDLKANELADALYWMLREWDTEKPKRKSHPDAEQLLVNRLCDFPSSEWKPLLEPNGIREKQGHSLRSLIEKANLKIKAE